MTTIHHPPQPGPPGPGTVDAVRLAHPSPAATTDRVPPPRLSTRQVGPARTLRFVPIRADLFPSHGGGYDAQKRAVDGLRPAS